jgi:hypothetical protein
MSGTQNDLVAASPLPIGEWQHVATSWDAGSRRKALFLNGVLVAQAFVDIHGDTDDLIVGADNLDAIDPWNGAIDEVLYYDRALSDAEIALLTTR